MVETIEIPQQIDRRQQAFKMLREVLEQLNVIASKAIELRTAPVRELDKGLTEIARLAWQQNLWLSITLEWIEDGRSGD